MALLEQTDGSQRVALGARCLVGRASTAGLLLQDRSVSAEHASLFWTGEAWSVRDLGSRNGTMVNDRRLGPGEKSDLAVGDVLQFGRSAQFVLRHDGPPAALAVPLDGDSLVLDDLLYADRDLLGLPDEEDPDVTLRRLGEGWVLEDDDAGQPVHSQARVTVGGRPWLVLVPPDAEAVVATTAFSSAPKPSLVDAHLHFGVSADEEHVTLEVRVGAQVFPVKSRTHHYMLLTLARQRLEDVENGIEDAEAGWLHADDLQKMLRMDRRALNTQVFRARRQLAGIEVEGGSEIIERRDPARQMRIGAAKIEIERLG